MSGGDSPLTITLLGPKKSGIFLFYVQLAGLCSSFVIQLLCFSTELPYIAAKTDISENSFFLVDHQAITIPECIFMMWFLCQQTKFAIHYMKSYRCVYV